MNICLIFFFFFFFLSILFFLYSIYFLILNMSVLVEFKIVSLNSLNINALFLFDWMSLLFMSFVMFISSMVIYYSMEYMLGDKNLVRFILLVVMFVVSMMLLIVSPNMISILLGWDGLGLVSYCLVIYYQNVKSFNAGMITALSNRVGDVAILLSIAWMMNFGSWNFIFYLSYINDFSMSMIMFFIILAAITKSAQIPFSSWLPAAMAAPTPVSSLVHSSTLVTAGVYLLIRFSPAMHYNCNYSYFLLFISSATMFMAGLGANFEFDLKKIIALSTLSQLGLMMSILFFGSYDLAFFHLLTHALFKALLFMCAGNIIHMSFNCQDIRFMGSMVKFLPLTCSFFSISNFALCGLPFLSGFYSKDLILEFFSLSYFNMYMYMIFFLSTGLTVSYTARLVFYVVLGNFNFFSLNSLYEGSKIMLNSMFGLIFFVIVMGSLLSWLTMKNFYFIILPLYMKFMTLFVIINGLILGYEVSKFSLNYTSKSKSNLMITSFFSSMWNLPFLSVLSIIKTPLIMGKMFFKNVDQGWSEYFGSQNLYNNLSINSKFFQYLFYNNLKIFFLLMLLFMLMVLMF
uniref:NADH-ubiquinone oxidoreductase chain 5 n=1 Tax=Stegobium paniceum TaxID=295656 RepID=A0A343C0X6_STEPN|nr:NADH dehydrogenase subunit 5 [Stegobium paniceum]ARH10877.1 NADH dehydrogenase subunit 5 [Stegobium paniceum]QCI56376.1 NADH dehydrogenase subunit 5 [Stegobium paniceum]QDH12143.1 NADH dehydrogenase subunit 5 [Stegobium paniceum]